MSKIVLNFAITAFIIAVFIPYMFAPISLFAQSQEIRIRIDGEFVYIPAYEQHPVIIDGRTLVPVRAVMEALGFEVSWYEPTQAITVSDRNVQFDAIFIIDYHHMWIRDFESLSLDVPPKIINGRTMIPVRAIAEAYRMEVRWNQDERIVDIFRRDDFWIREIPPPPTPIIPIVDWPEHLPKHVPGSISLLPERNFNTFVDLTHPMQFRAIWYYMCLEIINLPRGENQGRRLPGWERHNDMNRMQLMDFVYWADISREDFDAHVESTREMLVYFGIDYNNEWDELPNADIIFTFDQDIARYFYRRE